MNLLLFDPEEIGRPLPRSDARAIHLLSVLRRREGDCFDAGLVNGPRGKGHVTAIGHDTLEIAFSWGAPPPPLDSLTLVIGLPRPQTARKILQEAAALGVRSMHFVLTEKGEPGYAQSTLWREGEWRRQLRLGAEQAFATHLPEVSHGRALAEALEGVGPAASLYALDNYEAASAFSAVSPSPPVVVAVGPERGWSAGERDLFRRRGFGLVHLGSRVLRAETACVAAIAILKAKLGWF